MAQVKTAFTGTGTTDAIRVKEAALSVRGTFVGTIEVQRLVDGNNWTAFQTYTDETEQKIDNGAYIPTRVECTAYTSGTINITIVSN